MSISVGIIEDEAIIALDLKKIVQAAGYHVLFVANTVVSARTYLQRYKPDLVLLDIQLNNSASGLELANELAAETKHIFITSFSDHASIIQAALSLPLGYITKPYKEADVFAALNIFNKSRKAEWPPKAIKDSEEYVVINWKGKKRKIFTDDILYIEAWGNYVKLFLNTHECILWKISIRKFLTLLNPEKFIRIHRKTIANCTKLEKADCQHVYIGKQRLSVGRNYAKQVKKHFKTSVIH
ncbi:MAG: response regulator transcription factor [Cyclobacteriaceae bacterium]|nr:response regulator transcription factor [Cyclobacteriaceae bacterium]